MAGRKAGETDKYAEQTGVKPKIPTASHCFSITFPMTGFVRYGTMDSFGSMTDLGSFTVNKYSYSSEDTVTAISNEKRTDSK